MYKEQLAQTSWIEEFHWPAQLLAPLSDRSHPPHPLSCTWSRRQSRYVTCTVMGKVRCSWGNSCTKVLRSALYTILWKGCQILRVTQTHTFPGKPGSCQNWKLHSLGMQFVTRQVFLGQKFKVTLYTTTSHKPVSFCSLSLHLIPPSFHFLLIQPLFLKSRKHHTNISLLSAQQKKHLCMVWD